MSLVTVINESPQRIVVTAEGIQGAAGPAGAAGADGLGVPAGGTANQALTKIDGTDNNTQWTTVDKTFVGLGNVTNVEQVPISYLDTDGTLAANSDSKVATQKAVKTYVDSQVVSGSVPDATTLIKGKVKLAGDLAGTADLPTVPGLASKEPTITAGTSSEYYRGDKSFETLDTDAVVEASNLYFTNSRAVSALSDTLDDYALLSGATFTGAVSATNLSGTNTGDVTIGTANGLSVLGQAVSLGLSSTSTTGALSDTDWDTFNNKQASGNYVTALTGDVTASGPGSAASTLATVNSNVGSFGSSTSIPSVTVNAKGLVTAASGNAVVAPAGTLSGTTLNATVVSSSLTSVGTITSGTWTGTTIAVANGGTGGTTAPAARANLNIDKRTAVSNADYTILTTDNHVAQTGTMSASRTFTLPAANAVNPGQVFTIADESGTVTPANTIIISRAGADTIDGLTATVIGMPYGAVSVFSDGTSKWTITASNSANVQVFTSSGTWTKPAGSKYVRVVAIGAGGGGGSGYKGAAGSVRIAGNGGSGGGYTDRLLVSTVVGATETVTIGAGGSGGASQTSNDSSGSSGTDGGTTSFGTGGAQQYTAGGGGMGGGGGGLGAANTGVTPGSGTSLGGAPSNIQNSGANALAPGGGATGAGGAGGSINSSDAVRNGVVGGVGGANLLAGGAGGVGVGVSGSAGTDSATTDPFSGGGGGGGGAGSKTGNAGSGANGGIYGAGGGGGGAALNSVGNSGAGGNGAAGVLVVYSW